MKTALPRLFILSLLILTGFAQTARGQENIFHENMSTYGRLYKRPWLTPFTVEFQVGGTYYTGDLTGAMSIQAQNFLLNPAYSLALSYRVTDYISFRLQGSYFRLRAKANQPAWEGFAFRSNNLAGSIQVFHDFFSKRATEAFENRYNPYLGIGVGMVRFEPRDLKTGERYRAQLQSQDLPVFSNTALMVPVTFGVSYTMFEDTWVALEATYHFAMTDYIDGASPGTGRSANDGYYLFGIRAGVQLYGFFNYRNYLYSK